jgi:hypothetical protein
MPLFAQASDLEIWTNKDAGMHPNGFELKFFTNRDDARIFWTKKADASPADGLMYEEPIRIRRTTALWFFGFTQEPEVLSTPFQKALFFVESASGFEHFRIYTLQPKTNTVTLKNHSRFAADLSGWKLVSQKGEYVFEDIELSAGETISVSLPMKRVFSRIKLIAPDGNTKQIAELPIMLRGEMWKCETRRSESCGIISKTQD